MFPSKLVLLSCICLGAVLPTVAQNSAGTKPLDDLLIMQMNWDVSKSDDNAKPSVTLKFVPFEKHKQDGKSFTSYYVYAPGLPQNTPYTLIQWQIGWDASQPPLQPVYTDMYVNAHGVVMCMKPMGDEINKDAPDIESSDRLEVIAAGALGEPARYALYSEKDGIVAMGRLIVNPVQADDKGCHFQAIRAVGGAEIVLVEGTGFAPKAPVELSDVSTGKSQTIKLKTDENGRLETVVILAKPSQLQGTATITMKSDSCAPAVYFNWGHDTYQVQ